MRFLVKVRVDLPKMGEFGQRLQKGELDRRLIKSETWCLAADPAVGYSVWEAADRKEFDGVFAAWGRYYSEAEISEVIGANEAMVRLMKG
jgi:hypothetical protein